MRYGRSVEKGFLTVFNVPTVEDARNLLVFACGTNSEGEFVARELVEEQTPENLDLFSQRLAKAWGLIEQGRRARA